MQLVITEKPSVAMSIAKVLGVKNRQNGYIEGNSYIISWCVGHLVGLVSPEIYDEKYKKWDMEDLPIFPKEFKHYVLPKVKKQFSILKTLMNRKDINEVINACDAGREGELIFRLVYKQAKCKKDIKRLWISSMEDRAIKEGFENLKEGQDYDNLFASAYVRAKADWLVGMNLSRLYSLLYKQNYSVGRVQTPTLDLMVKREGAIQSFKKEKYYTVELDLDDFSLTTERIDNPDIAEQLKNLVPETIKIDHVEEKEKITKPDLPFDLTTLQRECNRYFGYSAKQSLDYAQSLYEKKLITYPRTDSRYLTEDMITSLVNNILGKNDFDTDRINVIFNSKKVTDHHAIIPTVSANLEEIENLPESEKRVFKLIKNKLHASFSYPLKEKLTKIIAEFDGFEFTTKGKTVIDGGFTKYLEDYKPKDKKDNPLPIVNPGDEFSIKEKTIKEKYTQPPKPYTEESLLKAMEIAGKGEIDKGIEVERVGLGTPATRAGIIENLIYKKYIKREGKNLIPTHLGLAVISIVAKELKNAKLTSDWETSLYYISKGKSREEDFLQEIEAFIAKQIDLYKCVNEQ
ncbi:MAG: DNA topoisomerase 3 [Peptoniphilus harei]|uniref:DNA topoisomerase 3 n=1 Tax=Peptoniphilus harei TaxID=54005 RepID=UPI00254D70D5|nr:DNA topoisomerase 3 [Peptoniphilus harei]MDK7755715.1 DNA topoisomerase 3 [Peptoniphilus harei]MDK7761229.1 DNA topoisomerase 3 [Peptoniphilus harei]MDK8271475.1 DNA topoisomerase 3 [Peptoniphilus harei]MDK8339996.1 DNA topoisomerase 3 [Peptoniphilus harei]